jgi:hypothetical protein
MLADRAWVPAHALLLVSFVLAAAGLAGLARSRVLSAAGTLAARVAVAGAALSTVEMTFHLAAVTERHAFAVGRSAPIVSIHMALAVVAYPVFGLAIAALAIIERGRLGRLWRAACVVGALGAIAHGVSAPIVVLSRDQQFSPLFKGAASMAIWFVVLSVVAPRLSRLEPDAARSGTANRPDAMAGQSS